MKPCTSLGFGDQATWGGRLPYDDHTEAMDEAIAKKVEETMQENGDYCPIYLSNITEALSVANDETMQAIEQALINHDPAVFDLIASASYGYWLKVAEKQAEKLLTQ